MARKCTICTHPQRRAIEAQIALQAPFRNISKSFDVGWQSVRRHAEDHVSSTMLQQLADNQQKGQGPINLRDVVDVPKDIQRSMAILDRMLDLLIAPMFPEWQEADPVADALALAQGLPTQKDKKPTLVDVDTAEVRRVIARKEKIWEMLLRASGEIQEASPVTNIMLMPQFIQMKALLVDLTKANPELKPKILEAIRGMEQQTQAQVQALESGIGAGDYQ